MGTNYSRGYQLEDKIRRILRDDGYIVIRSAGSKGAYDIVAIKNGKIRCIQAKRSLKEGTSYDKDIVRGKEWLKQFPPNTTFELWEKVDGIKTIKVIVIEDK